MAPVRLPDVCHAVYVVLSCGNLCRLHTGASRLESRNFKGPRRICDCYIQMPQPIALPSDFQKSQKAAVGRQIRTGPGGYVTVAIRS